MDVGVQALAPAIEQNCGLRKLNMEGNRISAAGFTALLGALVNRSFLANSGELYFPPLFFHSFLMLF